MAISSKNVSSSSGFEKPDLFHESKNMRKILVVGATGMIGFSILSHLTRRGHKAYGTTRNRNTQYSDLIYLNLESTTHEISFSNFDTVIICAAVTNLGECKNKPEYCELINVTNTISLINQCLDAGSFVIFISSSAVFDGRKKFYEYNDNTNPITKYGESKLSVEKHIKDLKSKNICVLRLTKVIKNATETLNNWSVQSLNLGKEINAFSNRFFSPIPIGEVDSALELLAERKKSGIFQLGGYEEISYYEYAKGFLIENQSYPVKVNETFCTDTNVAVHNSLRTHLPIPRP